MSAQRIAKHKYVQFIYEIVDESGMVVEKVDMPLNYVHGTDSGPWEKIEHVGQTAEKAHTSLQRICPPELVFPFHVLLVEHGRRICVSRKPKCESCPLASQCAFAH